MTLRSRLSGWPRKLADHPLLVLAGIFASIAGLIVSLTGSPFTSASDSAGRDSQAPSPSTSTPATSRSHPRTTPPGDECLTAELAGAPCTSLHRYEIVTGGASCTREDLVRHLGGHPAREVLLVAPKTLNLRGRSVCVTVDPGGDTARPAAGVLASSDSARWRRCVDERVGLDNVPCSMPHTGEFVGAEGNAAPDGAACRAAAETYMELALDRVSDRLAVAVIPARDVHDQAPRCLVRLLGEGSVLTDTLRRIGVNALPIVAA